MVRQGVLCSTPAVACEVGAHRSLRRGKNTRQKLSGLSRQSVLSWPKWRCRERSYPGGWKAPKPYMRIVPLPQN
jgi:hypothetical protein